MPTREAAMMLLIYTGAALFEIAGSFAFWAVMRLERSAWWLAPGVISLLLFAALLTRIDVDLAGRAYATFGGIFIVASLAWLWLVEGQSPDRWDFAGAGLGVAGAMVIMLGRHGAT